MEHPLFIVLVTLFIITSRGISQVRDCKPGNNGSKVAITIVVDQSGMGNFRTIQEAIDSIPANNDQWIKVQINPGTYTEQVAIPIDKPCIFLEGQDSSLTTITYDAHERTDLSATFASRPTNIVAKGITFKNSCNLSAVPAVSAVIYGDKTAFYNCAFLGFQDTIWDALGRHYFSNCYIEGAVDFIFGVGKSFYEGCSINVTGDGFITAQGREFPFETNGFVFSNCTVTGIQGFQAYLGRAYRPYATVIFQSTFLSEVVQPLGWDAWQYPGQESNFTFAEIDCKGAGSDTSKRVPWEKKLDGSSQLEKFSKSSFIDRDGWLAKLPL
ncbi:probable pectinesterase 55 [Populus nigra]|uniref:probable pectinesterase 55 n=1 Tax=Populus nigra TaxID=3691 RepID=UPI002B26CACC|nr:probable pectinesterase 55 [Populus nigra]